MYKKHFGLTTSPFSIAPNPRFLFMTEQHREALAHLVYGIRNGGFVLLTGEVGTGKTTICRGLLAHVPESTEIALVLNPRLTAPELLGTVCDEFGVRYPPGNTSIKLYIDLLNAFLLEANANARSTVLVIDEAQNLSPDVLEQMRLLTNLETDERKLLQVIMVGQPELRDMLGRPELRQLAQRITARYHLGPLSREDVADYVAHRLGIAGATRPLFSAAALRQVARLSRGIPRLINTICDRALLGTHVRRMDTVTPDIVTHAAREVLGTLATQRRLPARAAAGFVFAGVAAAAGYYHYAQQGTGLPWQTLRNPPQEAVAQAPAPPAPEPPTLEQAPAAPKAVPPAATHEVPPLEQVSVALATVTPAAPPEVATSEAAPVPNVPTASVVKAPERIEWPTEVPRKTGRALALGALFDRWGLTYERGDPRTACRQAARAGLRCLNGRGNMGRLRRFDRPVVLKLFDAHGVPFYATLVRITGDEAVVLVGGERRQVPLEAIEMGWLGDYTLLWRPPPGYERPFRAGTGGTLGEWLEDRMAHLPEGTLGQGGVTRRLVRFQTEAGLVPDGVLGPKTLIALTTATDADVPRLAPAPEGG